MSVVCLRPSCTSLDDAVSRGLGSVWSPNKSQSFSVFPLRTALKCVSCLHAPSIKLLHMSERHSAEQHGQIFLMLFWHRNLLTQNQGFYYCVFCHGFMCCIHFVLFFPCFLKEKQEAGYNARKSTHSVQRIQFKRYFIQLM